MNRLNSSDLIAAAAPLIGSVTLADINSAAQIIGAGLGAAYLVWKWRREARATATSPTPPPAA